MTCICGHSKQKHMLALGPCELCDCAEYDSLSDEMDAFQNDFDEEGWQELFEKADLDAEEEE